MSEERKGTGRQKKRWQDLKCSIATISCATHHSLPTPLHPMATQVLSFPIPVLPYPTTFSVTLPTSAGLCRSCDTHRKFQLAAEAQRTGLTGLSQIIADSQLFKLFYKKTRASFLIFPTDPCPNGTLPISFCLCAAFYKMTFHRYKTREINLLWSLATMTELLLRQVYFLKHSTGLLQFILSSLS